MGVVKICYHFVIFIGMEQFYNTTKSLKINTSNNTENTAALFSEYPSLTVSLRLSSTFANNKFKRDFPVRRC